ncbi:hypothetical protein IMSAG013_00559 [Clostridiales bacterium]|nr:hypothetical protein IMSAG013_00559 [Clostridiales bacterium]
MKKLFRKMMHVVWKRDDVVISGYYGYGSLGDEAVLEQIIASLQKNMPDCRIGVLSAHRRRQDKTQGVHRIPRANPLAVLWALLRCRLLISGGGSLLQDTTSKRSLFYYTAIIRAAHFLGARVFIYANGIGPLSDSKRAGTALRCAHAISVRDLDSFYAVLAMGIAPEKVTLSADPIFLLRPDISGMHSLLYGSKYFVVSLRTCCNGEIEENILANACKRLKETGLEAVFVSMQDSFDRDLCMRVCRACGGVMAEKMTASAFAKLLSGAQFVISMRLHCILMAALSGTPAVALSYDCKIDSAMEYLEESTTLDAFFFTERMLLEACRRASVRGNIGREQLRARAEVLSCLAQKDAYMAAGLLSAGRTAETVNGWEAPAGANL